MPPPGLHAGHRFDRAEIAVRLADGLVAAFGEWHAGRAPEVYRELLEGVGEPVAVRPFDGDVPVGGTMQGVDADGCLIVATTDGVRTFAAGDVTLRNG